MNTNLKPVFRQLTNIAKPTWETRRAFLAQGAQNWQGGTLAVARHFRWVLVALVVGCAAEPAPSLRALHRLVLLSAENACRQVRIISIPGQSRCSDKPQAHSPASANRQARRAIILSPATSATSQAVPHQGTASAFTVANNYRHKSFLFLWKHCALCVETCCWLSWHRLSAKLEGCEATVQPDSLAW